MAAERQRSMAEKPEPAAGDSGRNPQRPAGGASNATAATEEARPDTSQLMEAVVEKENMRRAYHRVVSNKGSAGIDEMSVDELGAHLKEHWAEIRKQLLEGTYKPQAVRGVEIPKPGKKGTRRLGIPTVVDRLIQQALLQVLSPVFEPGFSESSYGFRPGRSAHQAVLQAQEYARQGYQWVVDLDLEKFFDRVKESVTAFITLKLKLKVNEGKSAVDRMWKRSFLGYTVLSGKLSRLRVAPESVKRLAGKLRQIFRMARGWSLTRLIKQLTPILRGWGNYYRLTEVQAAFKNLDKWIRRRLRCILWRQAKRVFTRARMLMKRGLPEEQAWRSATNGRGPWRNAGAVHMNRAFPKRFFDHLGLFSLLDMLRLHWSRS